MKPSFILTTLVALVLALAALAVGAFTAGGAAYRLARHHQQARGLELYGSVLRIGLRSDGKLQTDILGQQIVGGQHDTDQAGKWIWLRARWLDHVGVFESSTDGKAFEKAWTFEHNGRLAGNVASLSVGKVPFNGEPQDYTDAGAEGECEVDWVRLYGG